MITDTKYLLSSKSTH